MRVQLWLKLALINLTVVALLGTTLRYKIAYSLPFIDQKNLLHAHSHFAFTGWVSLALMALFIRSLEEQQSTSLFARFQKILWIQFIAAWGMLISFSLQGYGAVSIGFSTLSLLNSLLFAYQLWICSSASRNFVSTYWFRTAVIWNILSNIGTGALVYMMVTRTVSQEGYLMALYLFLHFQYNGWFFFGIVGLFCKRVEGASHPYAKIHNAGKLFTACMVPAYFLSILWLPMHPALYGLVVATAALQVVGARWLWQAVRREPGFFFGSLPGIFKSLVLLAAFAFCIKLILQLGSTLPALGKLAFGFRSIIIGYLHLILLGVISLYLVAHIFGHYGAHTLQRAKRGLWTFVVGLILNEIFLMLQGGAGMGYVRIPYINEMLLGAALIMLGGLTLSVVSFSGKPSRPDEPSAES
jgi:hypothetical protein